MAKALAIRESTHWHLKRTPSSVRTPRNSNQIAQTTLTPCNRAPAATARESISPMGSKEARRAAVTGFALVELRKSCCWQRCWCSRSGRSHPSPGTICSLIESTDDAEIDGHIDPLSSRIDGTVIARSRGRRRPGEQGRSAGRDRSARLRGRRRAGQARARTGAGAGRVREAGLRRGAGDYS